MEENVHKHGVIFTATALTLDTWEGLVIIVSIGVLRDWSYGRYGVYRTSRAVSGEGAESLNFASRHQKYSSFLVSLGSS